ncbi:hypothetical protein J4471_00955 [Candidatus Woesearchaeota archaeon]|nr:hypothetical protein [Candidatus Woesearchaeota archaeon]
MKQTIRHIPMYAAALLIHSSLLFSYPNSHSSEIQFSKLNTDSISDIVTRYKNYQPSPHTSPKRLYKESENFFQWDSPKMNLSAWMASEGNKFLFNIWRFNFLDSDSCQSISQRNTYITAVPLADSLVVAKIEEYYWEHDCVSHSIRKNLATIGLTDQGLYLASDSIYFQIPSSKFPAIYSEFVNLVYEDYKKIK